MKNPCGAVIQVLLVMIILHFSVSLAHRQAYIVLVRVNSATMNLVEIEDQHLSFLMSVKNSKEEAKTSLLYSYKNVNGFSALLTSVEAERLSGMDGVLSIIKSEPLRYKIQTTRSWDFTNLLEQGNEAPVDIANYGKDVVVGVLDTGIWPESQSFNDQGMEPIPPSWRGTYQPGLAFNSSHCNRKLIGARYYLRGYEAT